MANTPEDIAYEESVRLIETQLRSLDELRARTGTLLAATAITASFLGAAAFDRTGELCVFGWGAVVAFAVGVGACLWVLWPRTDAYKFALDPKVLIKDWVDTDKFGDVTAMKRFVAEKRDEHFEHHKTLIKPLWTAFRIAAGAIGVQVILWILELSS